MIYILAHKDTGKRAPAAYTGRNVRAYENVAVARRYAISYRPPADILEVDLVTLQAHWID